MIAPMEHQLAMLSVISAAVTISHEDLIVETVRLFGFDRTGADLREAIDRQLAALIAERRVLRDEDGLSLPD
jgi:hypothetical protein